MFDSKMREVFTANAGCNHSLALDWREGVLSAELTAQTNQAIPIHEGKYDS